MLDLLIIGGGPTGIAAGIAAAKAGLDFLIVEKGVMVNSIFNFPSNMTFFSTSKLLEIGEVPFISHTEKPTRREALEYYRRLVETWKLRVNTYEPVESMERDETDNFYTVTTSKTTYHWQKGAEVTMAVRKPTIYEKVKYWIKPNIENRIKEGSIKAHFETNVKEIKATSVILDTPKGTVEIENDFVFAMTGYKPNFPFLEKIGIEISETADKTPTHHSDTLETNLPGVYLAGVVCAGMLTSKLFIENTRDHGETIVEDIIRKREAVLKS